MQRRRDDLTEALSSDEIRRVRKFVRQSKDVPQLAGARMQAICVLANLNDDETPPLGPLEFVEFLRSSPLYVGEDCPKRWSLRRKRKALADTLNAA
jgi:hypothetical protein